MSSKTNSQNDRVPEKEFVSNPHQVDADATVVLTDDHDRPAVLITAPRDQRPVRFD